MTAHPKSFGDLSKRFAFCGIFWYFPEENAAHLTADDEMMRAKGRRRVALAVDDSPNAMRAVRFAARDILDVDTDAVLSPASQEQPRPRRASASSATTGRSS